MNLSPDTEITKIRGNTSAYSKLVSARSSAALESKAVTFADRFVERGSSH